MSFAYPFALVLLAPPLGLVAWLVFWRGQAVMRLPGHWHRTIEVTMQAFMAKQVVSQSRLPILFWLTIWTLLVLALARPILDQGAPGAYGNLAGRVIALDIGAGIDVEHQRSIAYRILDASPTVPTAIVVATGEAFNVVPLTTDRAHLDRYLQVIKPEVMPIAGRAPGIAIVHAESVLARANITAGQLVLLTGGRVPVAEAATAGDWLRALVVDRERRAEWEGYADRIGAQLTDETSIQAVIDELDRAVARADRDSNQSSDLALAPWMIALAAVLWLLFFRRVRSA